MVYTYQTPIASDNDAVLSFSIHRTECPKTNQVLVTLSQMQCGILHVFKIQQVLSKSEKSSLPNVKERFTRCFDLSAGLFMNMFLNTQFYKCIMYTRVLHHLDSEIFYCLRWRNILLVLIHEIVNYDNVYDSITFHNFFKFISARNLLLIHNMHDYVYYFNTTSQL